MIRILELFQRPWALQASYLEKAYHIVARHDAGVKLSVEEIEAATGLARAGETFGSELGGDTAVIRVQGIIAQHAALVNQISGPRGTSVESLRRQLNAHMADPSIERVLWDFDTPGGSVAGVDEFADEIHAAGKVKPMIGFTDSLCASAGYWFGAACTEFYAQRTAEIGGVGVYCVVDDLSVRAHNLGVKVHLVKAGANKGEFVDGMPVSAESLAALQADVDQYYAFFTGAVAKYRGLTMEQTLAAANGRSFLASTALEKGLIDGIRTRAEMFAPKSAGRPTTGARTMKEGTTETPKIETQQTPPATPAAQTAPPAVDAAAIAAKAVADERARLNALDALAADWPEHKGLIDRSKADGTSVQDTKDAILGAEGRIKQAKLAELRGGGKTAEPLANGNADEQTPKGFSADAIKERFASDSAFAAKYRTVDDAILWERAKHEASQAAPRR